MSATQGCPPYRVSATPGALHTGCQPCRAVNRRQCRKTCFFSREGKHAIGAGNGGHFRPSGRDVLLSQHKLQGKNGAFAQQWSSQRWEGVISLSIRKSGKKIPREKSVVNKVHPHPPYPKAQKTQKTQKTHFKGRRPRGRRSWPKGGEECTQQRNGYMKRKGKQGGKVAEERRQFAVGRGLDSGRRWKIDRVRECIYENL